MKNYWLEYQVEKKKAHLPWDLRRVDAVYMEIDIPLRQFPAAFQHLLEQPYTDQLALDDPRNFFYVPQQAGDKER